MNVAAAICTYSISTDEFDEKLPALHQELLQKANNKESYDAVADEFLRLRDLKQQNVMDTSTRDEQIRRINELQHFICHQPTHLVEFDETLVKRWIKQITIWDDHITVELKSGVNIDIDV